MFQTEPLWKRCQKPTQGQSPITWLPFQWDKIPVVADKSYLLPTPVYAAAEFAHMQCTEVKCPAAAPQQQPSSLCCSWEEQGEDDGAKPEQEVDGISPNTFYFPHTHALTGIFIPESTDPLWVKQHKADLAPPQHPHPT